MISHPSDRHGEIQLEAFSSKLSKELWVLRFKLDAIAPKADLEHYLDAKILLKNYEEVYNGRLWDLGCRN